MNDIKSLLNAQMARLHQRWAEERRVRETRDEKVQTSKVVGVDSSMSLNGNPCVILQNTDGSTQRAMSISSGLQPGQMVNVVRPKNSKYGVVSSMPAGKF